MKRRKSTKVVEKTVKKIKIDINQDKKCKICKQFLNNIKNYKGHPKNAVEEFIALTNEKLSIFSNNRANDDDNNDKEINNENLDLPIHKITNFNIYDTNKHLCPIDNGLIETDVLLYLSGDILPIYLDKFDKQIGIAAYDLGPINEWYTTGFDGGEKALIVLVTPYAQYILMEPSKHYENLFKTIQEKIKLSKIVIEFLLDEYWKNPNYEDLLSHLTNYNFSEDNLLNHSQFIYDQVNNFHDLNIEDSHDDKLINISCMKSLIEMTLIDDLTNCSVNTKSLITNKKKSSVSLNKSTTTNLVKAIFEDFFPNQLNRNCRNNYVRCGFCKSCQMDEDLSNLSNQNRGTSDVIVEAPPTTISANINFELKTNSKDFNKNCKWLDENCLKIDKKNYYNFVQISDNLIIESGDYVLLKHNLNDLIVQISFMYDELPFKKFQLHGRVLLRGIDTILGETSNPNELFQVNQCNNYSINQIIKKVEVNYKKLSKNWSKLGGIQTIPEQYSNNNNSSGEKLNYFFTKYYDPKTGRFEDYVENSNKMAEIDKENYPNFCQSCKWRNDEELFNSPQLINEKIKWRNNNYSKGDAIFLHPSINLNLKSSNNDTVTTDDDVNELLIDDVTYPEYYRKFNESKKNLNDSNKPFVIGLIEYIISDRRKTVKIDIKIRLFYRPEDTIGSIFLSYKKDLNLVYWTEKVVVVPFDKVMGKCILTYGKLFNEMNDWNQQNDLHFFYFTESYDFETNQFNNVPEIAKSIGENLRKESFNLTEKTVLPRPLKCLELFAGCGGLSLGLHQSGLCETKWAIEKEPEAAKAFQLNNKNCQVFIGDCNDYLNKLLTNNTELLKNFPQKGDVEILIGGPPCQGFTKINRFNYGEYSKFKNSLITTFLSFCEYYRPKYCLLENVRNFIEFKNSMILKLTINCLLTIGYQIQFGILQAGHYGIPQTRKRLILIATAPNLILPKLPEPLYVFDRRQCHLSFFVDGKRYRNGQFWEDSAPYRTINVRDALLDLPDIKNGKLQQTNYDSKPTSHYQKLMRINQTNVLTDHICKQMAPIVNARIERIPIKSGSDWRDLPNIIIQLDDGSFTNKLQYLYHKKKQKRTERPKGVCKCSIGLKCDQTDRQMNTLIPWCLPHTGDRNNNWSGLYGRLEWDGIFSTTITNPEPMGKQGKVLHPEQNRVVSIRECARSQGFPDSYQFSGNVLEKYRQIGNAVPPPMGLAIGNEIKKALISALERNLIVL